jgi:hypothetical protein
MTVQGDYEYNSDCYQGVEFYFYLYAAVMESLNAFMMVLYDPMMLARWWPRVAASYWDFAHAFLQEKE